MRTARKHMRLRGERGFRRRAKISVVVVVALVTAVVCAAAGVWYANRNASEQPTGPESELPEDASDGETKPESDDSKAADIADSTDTLLEQASEDAATVVLDANAQSPALRSGTMPEESDDELQVQKITAGEWTTQRLLVLSSGRPYLLDFHTSLDGVSLEESEQQQLSQLAEELMAAPEESAGQEGDDAPSMMAGGEPSSEEEYSDAVPSEETPEPTSDDSATQAPRNNDEGAASDEVADESAVNATHSANNTTEEPANNAVVEAECGEAESGEAPQEKRQLEWSELLDLPLIRSRWLGNLVAEDDSTDQLISMYDRERDDVVAPEELREFLSRGLSRRPNLQMTDDGYEDGALERSPWGPLDTNDDYVLQPDEASQLAERLAALDVDEDGFINLAEATPLAADAMMASGSMGLSPKTMLLIPTDDEDRVKLRRDQSRLAVRVIEHYTFLGQITPDQWPEMPESEFAELDTDSNQEIDKNELRALFEKPADANVYVRFDVGNTTQVHAVIHDGNDVGQPAGGSGWVAAQDGGKLTLPGLALQIDVQDSFGPSNQSMVLGTVNDALGNENLREPVVNQYQLGDDAFEVVDKDDNGELDEEEKRKLWQWLRARQSSRMVGRWKLSSMPWFQLIDRNADSRLATKEIAEFSANFKTMFPGDEAVLGNSGPLLVKLEVQRRDPRLAAIPQPEAMTEAPPELVAADWFEAMDSNADGSIELDEFIGDAADFAELDSDDDGFVRRNEVYTP